MPPLYTSNGGVRTDLLLEGRSGSVLVGLVSLVRGEVLEGHVFSDQLIDHHSEGEDVYTTVVGLFAVILEYLRCYKPWSTHQTPGTMVSRILTDTIV